MSSPLTRLGYDSTHDSAFASLGDPPLEPARVTREDRGGRYLVLGAGGESPAVASGRLRHDAASAWPAVGDWVAVRPPAGDGPASIRAVLPRRTAFVRKASGTSSAEQVLAANVDVAFLVIGLDRDFRLRRIERYLTLAAESGADPVVVLSKADLCPDVELRVRQAEGVSPAAPVVAVSAVRDEGVDALRRRLGPGRTGVLLGSSGAGKSTLANRLFDEERLATGAVRAADSRGRHTTVRRELHLLPGDAGLLIDTPGLREIGLTGAEADADAGFPEIADLAESCRFRDCRHEGEPGCAVLRALGAGLLAPDRWESFLEQRRELAYEERRRDARARREEEERWRQITLEVRRMKKRRPERFR